MTDLKPPNCAKSRNKNGPKIKLLQTIQMKKECEKKALNIVIELIDGELEECALLIKLRSINACHYEDVIEERYILKHCGYVMCHQQLTNIPKQQYKIIQNQVYDITERKKFCSNICYRSSKYLQSQLLTSPLWLRDTEVIPKFELLKTNKHPENKVNPSVLRSNSPQIKDKRKKCIEQLEAKLSELTLQ